MFRIDFGDGVARSEVVVALLGVGAVIEVGVSETRQEALKSLETSDRTRDAVADDTSALFGEILDAEYEKFGQEFIRYTAATQKSLTSFASEIEAF